MDTKQNEAFEQWWDSYWTKLPNQPGILDSAFKGLAKTAWEEGYSEGYVDGSGSVYDRMK